MTHRKKHIRFRILLDEGLPPRKCFPKTNRVFDLKHLKHDFGLSGITDQEVYKPGIKEGRLVATYDIGDFEKLSKNKKTGIIEISCKLKRESADKKLFSLLNKSTRGKLYGKVNRITGRGVRQIFSLYSN